MGRHLVRVVLDANVLLSAFVFGGVSREVYDHCVAVSTLLMSEHIMDEFRRHLLGKFEYSTAEADARVDLLRCTAVFVEPDEVPVSSCRDPDDLPVLGTASAGEADALVSGDKDLLVLSSFRGIPIVTPRRFLEMVRKPE